MISLTQNYLQWNSSLNRFEKKTKECVDVNNLRKSIVGYFGSGIRKAKRSEYGATKSKDIMDAIVNSLKADFA